MNNTRPVIITPMRGYTKPLYILPFDHRATFAKALLAGSEQDLTQEQILKIKDAKQLIYEAYKVALKSGVSREESAILVDETFGEDIILDARKAGINFCICVEKSGQKEFDFEYGQDFPTHIYKHRPQFVKALVRYNPIEDQAMNSGQLSRLRVLSDFCLDTGFKFMLEVLVEPTSNQFKTARGDTAVFEQTAKLGLTLQMIDEMHGAGVEPDLWKLGGMSSRDHYKKIVEKIRQVVSRPESVTSLLSPEPLGLHGTRVAVTRHDVSMIVLGHGDNVEKVNEWLAAGRDVSGVVGFAVGRTVFLDQVTKYMRGELDRGLCIDQIASNFVDLCDFFRSK